MSEKKQKRYYTVGERVYCKPTKSFGVVKELNIKPDENCYKVKILSVDFARCDKQDVQLKEYDLWEIDKVKKTEGENGEQQIREGKKRGSNDVYFAKTNATAIVPSKREEDAGYDFYANLDEDEDLLLKVGRPTLVPTGIACCLPKKYCLNLKHERGSTGKIGMSILSGLVDSGYRGEIFVNIVATYRDVVITNKVDEVVHQDDLILYPTSKAIAQGTIDLVPNVNVEEIEYEELKAIPSERGTGKLGDSGK